MLHCQPIPIHANLSANSVDECKLKLKQSSVIVNGTWAVQLGKGGAAQMENCNAHGTIGTVGTIGTWPLY